jgi:flagellar protein FliL
MAGVKLEKGTKSKGGPLAYIIVAIAAVLLALGSGFGGYMLNKGKTTTIIKTVVAQPATTTEKKQVSSAKTLKLDSILVNLADPGVKRYLKIQIILGYENKKLDTELASKSSVLRDAILTVLRSKSSADFTTAGSTGIEDLKKQLKDTLNPYLTTAKLDNIYFTDILVQ